MTAALVLGGVPESERYRATMAQPGQQVQVLGDYAAPEAAAAACQARASVPLHFGHTGVAGLQGAEHGSTRFGVLDRWVRMSVNGTRLATAAA